MKPKKWTIARYTKYCQDSYSDAQSEYAEMMGDSALWYDLATCTLDAEEGLEEFIRDELKVTDVIGCLADDLAYPGNCRAYSKKKGA